MNEFNPLRNPLGYDINLNSSYQHNNEEVCIFQNDNNFSYLNVGNCQDQSMNIYNQCDEEKMEINEEQQDKINEKEFKEELEKQKEEEQSLKFDLKDYCVEKEMQQSGNELSDSFLDEQFFLNGILFPSDKKQNISYLSEIEGNAENFSIDKDKELKTLSKENKNIPSEGALQSKGCLNKNSANLNELNFFEEKSETEKSIIREKSEKNEIIDNIFEQKSKGEPKFKTEELKEIKENIKHLLQLGKSFEEKFGSKISENISSKLNNSSTGASITLNNSSKNRSNISKDISSEI